MLLESAGRLLQLGNKHDWIRKRRDRMLRFSVGNDEIVLTDQLPLTAGNVDFEDGWDIEDLVESVNRRVFFWRGNSSGLLKKDRGHFGTYHERGQDLVFLRIRLADAVAMPENLEPEFCRFNSGGPRCSGGKKSPRGPNTFVKGSEADFTLGEIREIVFRNKFHLPSSTELCFGSWDGPWVPLDGDDP